MDKKSFIETLSKDMKVLKVPTCSKVVVLNAFEHEIFAKVKKSLIDAMAKNNDKTRLLDAFSGNFSNFDDVCKSQTNGVAALPYLSLDKFLSFCFTSESQEFTMADVKKCLDLLVKFICSWQQHERGSLQLITTSNNFLVIKLTQKISNHGEFDSDKAAAADKAAKKAADKKAAATKENKRIEKIVKAADKKAADKKAALNDKTTQCKYVLNVLSEFIDTDEFDKDISDILISAADKIAIIYNIESKAAADKENKKANLIKKNA